MKKSKKIYLAAFLTLLLGLMAFVLAACSSDVQNITVTRLPDQTEYTVGETLDVNGGEIMVKWKEGGENAIALNAEGVSCSPKILDKAGPAVKITVTYQKKTTSFSVKVNEVAVVKVQQGSLPDKLNYVLGESLDLTGGAVQLTYNDAAKNTVMPMKGDEFNEMFSVSGFSSVTPGQIFLRVELRSDETKYFTFPVTVNVEPDKVFSMEIAQNIDKTVYYTGESLDLTGGKINIVYSAANGADAEATVDMSNAFMFSTKGFDNQTQGAQAVTISLNSAKNPIKKIFFVQMKQNGISGLAIQASPNKTEYYRYEELSLAGGLVKLTYLSGKTENVAMNDPAFESLGDTSAVGASVSIAIILKADNSKGAIFKIMVKSNPLSGLEISKSPKKTKYFSYETLNLVDGVLDLTYMYPTASPVVQSYDMGDEEFLTKFGLSGFNNTAAANGNQTVTVYMTEYKSISVDFTVEFERRDVMGIEIDAYPAAFVYLSGSALDLSGGLIRIKYVGGDVGFSSLNNDAFELKILETVSPVIKTIRILYDENIYIEFPVMLFDFSTMESLAVAAYNYTLSLATLQEFDATRLLLMYNDFSYLLSLYLPEDEFAWVAKQFKNCPYSDQFILYSQYIISEIPVLNNEKNPTLAEIFVFVEDFIYGENEPKDVGRWGIYNYVISENMSNFLQYYLDCAAAFLLDQDFVAKNPQSALDLWNAFLALSIEEQYCFLNIIDAPGFELTYFNSQGLQYAVFGTDGNVFTKIMFAYADILESDYGEDMSEAFLSLLIAAEMRLICAFWLENYQSSPYFESITVLCHLYLGAYTEIIETLSATAANWNEFEKRFGEYFDFLVSEYDRLNGIITGSVIN